MDPARGGADADLAAAGPSLADALIAWQRRHGRHDLPWLGQRDPYRVWLSEIMLQQTQVGTVLAYYGRFLARCPDVVTLAQASSDEVMGLWAGLGYYSRARNLHRCARQVVAEHGGQFPRRADQLAELPGIGRSTAAAIAAFCFDERVAILDGNVKRVLSRVLGFGDDLAVAGHERALWARATALLPARAADMPAYTQGLMDLGATLCQVREPRCGDCPWQARCVALAQGRPQAYPVKTRKLRRHERSSWCLWLCDAEGAVWLHKRAPQGIWAGLWAWPMFDAEADCQATAEALAALAVSAGATGGPVDLIERLPGFLHVLTHVDWTLHPRRLVLSRPVADATLTTILGPGRWWPQAALAELGLPAPLRKRLPIDRR